jgi:hypothetical protein
MKLKAKGSQTQMRHGHMHTHTCMFMSVRPSVLPPFSRFVSGTCSLTRVRDTQRIAHTSSMHLALMIKKLREIPGCLQETLQEALRQRKSTVDILPTVLCVRVLRSVCTCTRLRPSVRPASFYCCIQVSACSQCAKTLAQSFGVHLVRSVMPR